MSDSVSPQIIAALEALLFVAGKPLSLTAIVSYLGVEASVVTDALAMLQARYESTHSGLRLVSTKDSVQLYTAPEVADIVKDFLHAEESAELTKPQLETLSVIAYRGPLYKEELEHIRGVNCTLILRNLLLRGLVQMQETKTGEQYEVSADFLAQIGFSRVEDLPDFAALSTNELVDEVVANVTKEEI